MKFYLVTSSLNFNNIFSTGSISPKKFYKNRNFGTNIYYELNNEILENAILLYRNRPKVSIDANSNLSEHLVIFEINKKVNELIKINNNIYICYKTIYFNLDNVSIRFEDISNMNKTIKGAIYALETKETLKYIRKIKKIKSLQFKKDSSYIKSKSFLERDNIYDENYIKNEMDNDNFFDTLKGLYHGITLDNDRLLYSDDLDKYLFLENLQNLIKTNKNNKYFKNIFNFAIKEKSKEKNSRINFIIDIDEEDRRIILNNKILSEFLTKEEIELLKLIYDNIIILNFIEKDRFSNDYVEKLIVNIGQDVTIEKFKKDIRKIYLGIVKNDIDVKYDQIDSNILKNLYLVLLKRKGYKELRSILQNKKVANTFIAYSIYCCILGFTNLPQQITSNIYTNEIKAKYIDKQTTILQEKIAKFYKSEDLYKKQIYQLLFLYKKVNNYEKILNKNKELKAYYGIEIRVENRGDRLNMDIKQHEDIYRLVLYTKIYNVKYSQFKEDVKKLNIDYKHNSKKFPYFKYHIYDNKTFRELSYREEKEFLKALNKIGNCLN
ncbi:hypothetical protein RBU61_08530 [Tissierella sp. MB52-C2]|uniref:hypothetical protein n=1 Tax=Tissierella sp. MB52-C2 TaxID=3070999 RepID=UPI00280A5548|nr:hypothetical protein [Tissierella sp. MB52-C2]WMM26711.1 hypothetical protein RBU61_08530 [Tissierella sp. MB52-C2]